MNRIQIMTDADSDISTRINRIITALIVITVISSILTGAYTVYKSVIDRNIVIYLDSEFVFADTQLVQSSVDNINREISVSLVETQLSDTRNPRISEQSIIYIFCNFNGKPY